MMPRLPDGWLLFVALVALVLCLPSICFGTPFLWVADDGDDASANPWSPTTPFATYDRAIQYMNEIGSDTVGVKFMPGNRPPTSTQATIIIHGKPDVAQSHQKREVIAGHGELPDIDITESSEAGLKVTQQWVWEVFTAPNGQSAERCVGMIETVEVK